MTWFVESPWPALMLGFGLEVILAIALVRTGRGVILGAMVLVLAVTAGLVLLERYVVTEREEVEDTLAGVAAALEANDAQQVLAAMTPRSPKRGEVKSALDRVKISRARIGGDLEIRFRSLTNPRSAIAIFTGIVDAKDTRGQLPYEHLLRRFQVTLHRDGDRWLIDDYTEPPSRGNK